MNRRTILSGCMSILGSILGSLAVLGTMTKAHATRPLAAWRWKSRLLLVFAPDDTDPDLQAQRRMLGSAAPAAAAHDLVTIEIVADRTATARDDRMAPSDAASLRRDYGVPLPRFCVVLIGKDGGEKLRRTRPITPESLFATIDSMPMGREEAQRRSQTGADRP